MAVWSKQMAGARKIRKAPVLAMLLASSSLALAGCSAETIANNGLGALGGGVAGIGICKAAGCGTLGTIIAGVAGAAVGQIIAEKLSENEKKKRDAAIATALQTGEMQTWSAEAEQSGGEIIPLNNFERDGMQCTRFRETYSGPDGDTADEYDICKDADGNIVT